MKILNQIYKVVEKIFLNPWVNLGFACFYFLLGIICFQNPLLFEKVILFIFIGICFLTCYSSTLKERVGRTFLSPYFDLTISCICFIFLVICFRDPFLINRVEKMVLLSITGIVFLISYLLILEQRRLK